MADIILSADSPAHTLQRYHSRAIIPSILQRLRGSFGIGATFPIFLPSADIGFDDALVTNGQLASITSLMLSTNAPNLTEAYLDGMSLNDLVTNISKRTFYLPGRAILLLMLYVIFLQGIFSLDPRILIVPPDSFRQELLPFLTQKLQKR